ncbi:MAG TPA: hypothetical protein VMZ11_00695 [Mycobacteriales bacterium]|nr:hypothetical protein [Mycobacteriales bacterium]
MPRELYVRPPLVAREARSPRAAVWRVRVVGIVVGILTLLALLWLGIMVSGVTNGENPGLGATGQPGSGTVSSALVP